MLQISTSETKQAIASLFEVTDLFTCTNDSGMKTGMMEKKKVYGTLLQSLDLVNMSKDSFEEKIMSIKSGLDSKVRIAPVALTFVCHYSFLQFPFAYMYQCVYITDYYLPCACGT